jgi:hypothetical protein
MESVNTFSLDNEKFAATFITFADSRLELTLRRIGRQARKLKTFSTVVLWNEGDLDQEFRSRHADLLRPGVRGFGYWIWKPQVILQGLEKCQLGDFLIYVDAGCHLNHHGVTRLMDYFTIVKSSATGILAFELKRNGTVIQKEESWNKADTLHHFRMEANENITKTAQIEATVIIIQKRESTHLFFQEWLEVMQTHPNLMDDSESLMPNSADFIEHRHDQAIFSLLAKRDGVALLPFSENFPTRRTSLARKPAWSDLRNFPIQTRRDKVTKLTAIWRDFINALKFIFLLRFRHRISSRFWK